MEEPKFIVSELYKGRVKIKFYPKFHQYWVSVDGQPFKRKTGVTTIIGIKDKSKPLSVWQQQITADYLINLIEQKKKIDIDMALEAVVQCDVQREEAADIGKEIHEWIEFYIKNKLKIPGFENVPNIPKFPEAITGINSFLEWEKKHKIKFISTEQIVYSLEHDFVGIEDFVMESAKGLNDGDFKSSNGLYNSVRMQTAAYAKARMEAGGKKSKGRWAVRLSKHSEEEYIKKEERKREIRRAIARIKGQVAKDYPMKPYQVFEAKFLDDDKSFFKRDFEAFLHCKAFRGWDLETDQFYKGDNW